MISQEVTKYIQTYSYVQKPFRIETNNLEVITFRINHVFMLPLNRRRNIHSSVKRIPQCIRWRQKRNCRNSERTETSICFAFWSICLLRSSPLLERPQHTTPLWPTNHRHSSEISDSERVQLEYFPITSEVIGLFSRNFKRCWNNYSDQCSCYYRI